MEINSDQPNLYNRLGYAYQSLNRSDDALVSYDNFIRLQSNNLEAYNNRGVILHVLKRFDEALISYDHEQSTKYLDRVLVELIAGQVAQHKIFLANE